MSSYRQEVRIIEDKLAKKIVHLSEVDALCFLMKLYIWTAAEVTSGRRLHCKNFGELCADAIYHATKVQRQKPKTIIDNVVSYGNEFDRVFWKVHQPQMQLDEFFQESP